jgi:hypothetical protein
MSLRTKACAAVGALLILAGWSDAVISTGGMASNSSDPGLRALQMNDLINREQVWWLLAAVAVVGAVASAQPAEQSKRERYWANVGTAGVATLLLGFGLIAVPGLNDLEGIGLQYCLPSCAVILTAGIGAFASAVQRRRFAATPQQASIPPPGAVPTTPSPAQKTGRYDAVVLIAWALVITAVFLSTAWADRMPACGSGDPEPTSAGHAAATATLVAMGYGLIPLAQRRWILAIFCLAIPALWYVGSGFSHFCD